jgi:hypothetical protein
MYSLEQIKQYASTCWIYDCQSGEQVRGFMLSIGNTPVMCLFDTTGAFRWYANRIGASERTVRVMLAAMDSRPL